MWQMRWIEKLVGKNAAAKRPIHSLMARLRCAMPCTDSCSSENIVLLTYENAIAANAICQSVPCDASHSNAQHVAAAMIVSAMFSPPGIAIDSSPPSNQNSNHQSEHERGDRAPNRISLRRPENRIVEDVRRIVKAGDEPFVALFHERAGPASVDVELLSGGQFVMIVR